MLNQFEAPPQNVLRQLYQPKMQPEQPMLSPGDASAAIRQELQRLGIQEGTDSYYNKRGNMMMNRTRGFTQMPLGKAMEVLEMRMDATPAHAERYRSLDDNARRQFWQKLLSDPFMSIDEALQPDGGMMRQLPRLPEQEGRFDDARAYRVADAGGMGSVEGAIRQAGETPALGGDSTTARRLADNEIAFRDAMNGLSGIMEELASNPNLLEDAHTWRGRAETGLLRLRDRSGIEALDIGPEDEMRLAQTTAYKQELLTRVNQYIKDITGAQVGQGDETRRLMAVQANENDSPTQVIAKIENAMNLARLDIVRRQMMRRSEGSAPTDKDVRAFLRERGTELFNLARQEGLSPSEARLRAAEMLSEEFGW